MVSESEEAARSTLNLILIIEGLAVLIGVAAVLTGEPLGGELTIGAGKLSFALLLLLFKIGAPPFWGGEQGDGLFSYDSSRE